jgi:hypothetical protein
MKHQISLGIGALALTASSAAFADPHVSVSINPFGWWGEPPPVIYEPPRYYAPPTVYYGRGHWGDRDARGHRDDRGRWDHRGDDRRR